MEILHLGAEGDRKLGPTLRPGTGITAFVLAERHSAGYESNTYWRKTKKWIA